MPAGTASTSAIASFSSPSSPARSKPGPICTGLASVPCATRTIELVTRSKRLPSLISPSFSSVSIHSTLAEMNKSAGAPCSIWRASAEEPASETTAWWPVAFWYSAEITSIASFRLAAANTVTESCAKAGAAASESAADTSTARSIFTSCPFLSRGAPARCRGRARHGSSEHDGGPARHPRPGCRRTLWQRRPSKAARKRRTLCRRGRDSGTDRPPRQGGQ